MGKLVIFHKELGSDLSFFESFDHLEEVYFLSSDFKLYRFADSLLVFFPPYRVFNNHKIFKVGKVFVDCSQDPIDKYCSFSISSKSLSIPDCYNISTESLGELDALIVDFEGSFIKELSWVRYSQRMLNFIKHAEINIHSYFYIEKVKKYLVDRNLAINVFDSFSISEGFKSFERMPALRNFKSSGNAELSKFDDLNLDVFDFCEKKPSPSFMEESFFDANEKIDPYYLEQLFKDPEFFNEIEKAKLSRIEETHKHDYLSRIEKAIRRSKALSISVPEYNYLTPSADCFPENLNYLRELENFNKQEESHFKHVDLYTSYISPIPLGRGVFIFRDLEELFDPYKGTLNIPDIEDEIAIMNAYIDEALDFYFKKEISEPPYFSWEE
ncbi:hypothetical protein MHC_05715 [Mycoplasma haemocanis str. Illinois]|uniref:Uncharacterized protein n=1 Tax=Mycoplasma haemocanis (strain Illinois) TaxID=1111676 RepID=H6N8M4_MYCHN|nr:hypothetical protein [Mycoplasma haemocanis]AEW45996.1 hypothetical protein MHC_05715 [Mycoplasma haemocanis str. Illinois]